MLSEIADQDRSVGPQLQAVLSVYRANEDALAYPRLESLARELVEKCSELESPLMWPVGEPAERLVGAALCVGEGEVRARGWTTDLQAERVLLVAVAAVTPIALVEASHQARALGAAEVHACGLAVAGLDLDVIQAAFNSYDNLRLLVPG